MPELQDFNSERDLRFTSTISVAAVATFVLKIKTARFGQVARSKTPVRTMGAWPKLKRGGLSVFAGAEGPCLRKLAFLITD
jgi:hypothetical protein